MTDAQTAQVDQERIAKIQKRLEHFKSQEYDRRGVQVIVDAYKADVAYLLALASLAARLQQPAKTACDDCLADRRRLAAALITMLGSAHPSEKEHPKMFAAWQVGRQAVQHYEHAGGSLNGPSRLGASPNTDTGGESVLVPSAPLPHAAPQEDQPPDLRAHLLSVLDEMGVRDGATLATVQRELHVGAATGMRLFALLEGVKALESWPSAAPLPAQE